MDANVWVEIGWYLSCRYTCCIAIHIIPTNHTQRPAVVTINMPRNAIGFPLVTCVKKQAEVLAVATRCILGRVLCRGRFTFCHKLPVRCPLTIW